ncbi:hypothetical protein OG547_04545 [Streptomyces longwoodensis]|uniref:hypothetical protein n=1 Tax=Streptomyces longwoodensis TaxID=68231 RepID=UPI002ECFB871|nr:hypothetical protein OG547_04545 [Streptomyces longwoodensis]
MRTRPIMLIAATATAIATAAGVASAATGTDQPTATAHGKPSGNRLTAPQDGFAVTSTRTSPIGAGAVAKILASCLGQDASNFHAVIAVRAPVATKDTDGVVIAVNSARQYVQCETKGHKGTSMSVPPTFINDRLWGTGHLIEFFDSFSEPAHGEQTLSLGAGHYTPDVARITISYGDNPTQYPALMADGAFVYTAALSGPERNSPSPYVHAYNAAGQEIYNQQTEPTTKQ